MVECPTPPGNFASAPEAGPNAGRCEHPPETVGLPGTEVQVALHDLVHGHAASRNLRVRPDRDDAVRAARQRGEAARLHDPGPRCAVRRADPGDACAEEVVCSAGAR